MNCNLLLEQLNQFNESLPTLKVFTAPTKLDIINDIQSF